MGEFIKRVILIVMDGCGAGEAPDAPAFGDRDHPATIRHVWESQGPLDLPNLAQIGFLGACSIATQIEPIAEYGRLQEMSMGKDSVTGHWEMMGIHTRVPFPTYPNGFPAELVKAFEAQIGRKVLGNKAASGIQIIEELGPEHLRTGCPILYTSADSVFQIAAHEDVTPLSQLYEFCQAGRTVCQFPHNVQRVIARPFRGSLKQGFVRTEGRRDFPLDPPNNAVDLVQEVRGVGVVPELFNHRGFVPSERTQNNAAHLGALLSAMDSTSRFIFANFEDFDMLYGHRNDPAGFAQALVSFDGYLGQVMAKLEEDDLLLLTADHGNDPTTASTDHSREFVPFCAYQPQQSPKALGDQQGMWHVGRRVCEHLGLLDRFLELPL